MCKTFFITDGPSLRKIDEKYGRFKNEPDFDSEEGKEKYSEEDKEKYKKEEEIYFTTLSIGKVTGVITEIDDSHAALIMTFKVKKIDQDVVREEKTWEIHYNPYAREGMIYCIG